MDNLWDIFKWATGAAAGAITLLAGMMYQRDREEVKDQGRRITALERAFDTLATSAELDGAVVKLQDEIRQGNEELRSNLKEWTNMLLLIPRRVPPASLGD